MTTPSTLWSLAITWVSVGGSGLANTAAAGLHVSQLEPQRPLTTLASWPDRCAFRPVCLYIEQSFVAVSYLRPPDRAPVIVNGVEKVTLSTGTAFGELALISGESGKRQATVRCTAGCRCSGRALVLSRAHAAFPNLQMGLKWLDLVLHRPESPCLCIADLLLQTACSGHSLPPTFGRR